jgi:hypothetical protein
MPDPAYRVGIVVDPDFGSRRDERAGLSDESFIIITAALNGARFYVERRELFTGVPVNVHPSNLDFVRNHAAEIARLDSTLPP